MELNARLLSRLPLCWNGSIDVGLMNDLWNHLRSILDEIRSWSRDLCARDGICSSIFEQETDKSAESIHEHPDNAKIDYQEDNRPFAHLGGSRR